MKPDKKSSLSSVLGLTQISFKRSLLEETRREREPMCLDNSPVLSTRGTSKPEQVTKALPRGDSYQQSQNPARGRAFPTLPAMDTQPGKVHLSRWPEGRLSAEDSGHRPLRLQTDSGCCSLTNCPWSFYDYRENLSGVQHRSTRLALLPAHPG